MSPAKTATHWRRGGKDHGWAHGESGVVVVEVWWPLSDPCPTTPLWTESRDGES